MKRILFLLFSLGCMTVAMGQLKPKEKCPDIFVDILNGTVNQMKPNYGPAEIQAKIPCFTSVEEEGGTSKCGGAIYYKDKDVTFYTKRDYIEIGPKFIG